MPTVGAKLGNVRPEFRLVGSIALGTRFGARSKEMETRFGRQTILPQVGKQGQRRLNEAKVLVMGCGALGSHTATALLRAGVRKLILVDRDILELHNLHRVAVYTEADLGRPKAEALAERLQAVDSNAEIEVHVIHFGLREADLVVAGSDNAGRTISGDRGDPPGEALPVRPKRRLAARGKVRRGDGVLFFDVEGISFTVFPDGRAIVKGTKDPTRAQALYDQYISR